MNETTYTQDLWLVLGLRAMRLDSVGAWADSAVPFVWIPWPAARPCVVGTKKGGET